MTPLVAGWRDKVVTEAAMERRWSSRRWRCRRRGRQLLELSLVTGGDRAEATLAAARRRRGAAACGEGDEGRRGKGDPSWKEKGFGFGLGL